MERYRTTNTDDGEKDLYEINKTIDPLAFAPKGKRNMNEVSKVN